MAKHVSAYRGAGLKPNRVTKKPKQDWVSAYKRDDEKNRGGIIGGLGYVGGNLGLGIAGIGEGVGDIVSAGADLLRGDTDMAKYRFLDNKTAEAQQSLREWYNPGSVMEFAGDVASGIGQSSVFLLDAVAPGVGTGLFFAGVGGQGISSAAAQTGDVGWREVGYGVASGVTEGLLEKALGAGSKVAGKLGASITRKTGTAIGQKGITTALTKSVGNRAWSSIAKATAKDAAGEFAEEFASEYIDTALLHAFGIDPNASTSFGEAVRAGMVGLFSGGIMGAPANVINYKNAAKAGRTIRESGETENLLNRAQATVSVLREQEAVKKAEGKKVKKTDEATEAAEQKGFLARQGAKREARRAAEYAAKLEKNVNAYRNMKEEMRNSEVGDALLGELRGNLYFTNMAYAVEEAETVLRNVDDAQAQKIVDYINTAAKAAKQEKSDYTVEDFRLNRDGILSQFAAKGRMEQLINGEWTEAEEMAAQAAQEAKDARAEQQDTKDTNEATEAVAGAESDPWEAVAGTEGYGTQSKEEEELLRAASNQGVPKSTIPAMLKAYREGTDMTPAEFAEAWGDGVIYFGRYGLNEQAISKESGLARMSESARKSSMREGKKIADEETRRAQKQADAKRKQTKGGSIVKGEGLIVNKLSQEQYAAYKAAEILAKNLGVDVVVEKDIDTVAGETVNGYYDRKTNAIHINISAMRDGKNVAVYTLAHEVTHYIKEWSPANFKALSDFAMDKLGRDAETLIDRKLSLLRKIPDYKDYTVSQLTDLAAEEVVADGMELALTDGAILTELAQTDKTLWEKIRDKILEIIGRIRDSYKSLSGASKTAQVLQETMESLDEIEQLFYEGIVEAGERARTAEYGVEIDEASGTALFSVQDAPQNETEFNAAVDRLVAKLGVDKTRAENWVKSEMSLSALILREDMYQWAHKKADRRRTAIVKNSDYKQGTLDFSNICRKRRQYTKMMERLQKQFPNRLFTAEDFALIRDILMEEDIEVACGLCYVEDRRQNEGYIATNFREAVQSWRAGNKTTFRDSKSETDVEYSKGAAKAMEMLGSDTYVPTIADLTTVDGMDELGREHPNVLKAWNAFNNSRGMQSSRLVTAEAEYQRQILKYTKNRVKAINDLGGLRIFSFSDFEEFHLIDIIQAVQDCAAMGIKIQFYTKVPSFAYLMKDTGAKGNMSLIPKGQMGYHLEGDRVVLDYDNVEGINTNDEYFKKLSRDNPNIGTVLVGINETHIRAAMADSFIDYIIPFHSGQSGIVRQIKKIDAWENYKDVQTEKWLTKAEEGEKRGSPGVNIYTDVLQAAEKEGRPITNERQFVEKFLQVCADKGVKPRFWEFLNTDADGKYAYTKGYYKLLLDFKMFDKNGEILPQGNVVPEFDEKLLTELTEKYVASEKTVDVKTGAAFARAYDQIVDRVINRNDPIYRTIKQPKLAPAVPNVKGVEAVKKADRVFSIGEDTDTAYISAVESGDMETAQKMVDEVAKAAGYTEEMFHGMGGRYNVYKSGNGQYGSGVYFTADKDIAADYGKVVDHLYVKVGKIADYEDAYRAIGKTDDQTLDDFAQTLGFPSFDEMVNDWDNDPTDIASNSELMEMLKNRGFEGFLDDGNAGFVLWDFDGIAYRIKSADPVTYDDAGNVIPLSERFNEANPDIRYSLGEDTENADVSENAADANVSGNEEEITDRDMLLAMAEQLVGNAEENKILSDYKAQYDTQKERQKKLDSIYDEIGEQKSMLYTSPDATQRSAAAKRLKELYVEMNDVSQELAGVDRELSKIEGMKAVRNLLVRERKTSKKIYQEKYERMNKARREATETTELRRQTRRIYNRLYRMLAHPTKTKNVPYEMQGITADALRAANMDLDALERLEQLEEQLSKLEREGVPDPDKIAKKEKEIKAQEKKVGSMKEQIQVLVEIFEKSKEINTGVGANVYSDDALAILKDLQTEIGNVSIRNANREQLASLKKFYDTLYTRINNANKAFATEKAASIDQMSTKANTQVKEAKSLKFLSPKPMEITGKNSIRRFFWKNMKPLTVFEAIGSDELMSIFKRVLDGEDVWITDILEAKKALDEAKKKYGYNKWNFKERREVTTADGSKVSLTLGEMMSLYAYMFREQAEEHLSAGGFVFAPDAKAIEKFKDSKVLYEAHLNDQTPHRMRKEDIAKMSEMLTQEQRAYAEAVQKYLTGLGAKGNEVSRKLYGIDLFKETAYFPIKSSHDYIETSTGKSGDPNIKSRGTFKETVPKAGNPIVLEDFMEVVGNHVNTMATYHAFVLPVEDLTRVWNYTPVNIKRDADGKAILDENGMPVADTEGAAGYNSLKAEITKKYGKEANDYILQLLRDLNGGARRESAASILDKGLTAFKRSATMLSLSTIVQQPTSIIRAMAYVDAKHFTGASFVPWETVKKYAPVAAIKEMGGFDTGTGARTAEFINAKEYDSIKDAAKAAVTPEIYGGDPNVRAEAFGWLTGKADEVSWRYMFGAIVNEQAEKLGKPKESEEVMKAAGERFAEVVRRTQVYDSTLTRSEFMRSKDGLMKMATAFGAEPTTVVSMVADAIIKAERGDKTFLRKSAAGIAFSVIANAAVASLIYAMRDDDEDETLPEKYVQSVTSELIEGFNPLEYLPVARDVVSLFKGYEIERSDMALVGNLMDQVELITSSKRSVPDKIFGVTGAVSAFFGLPVTNVYRDFKGLVKTGQSFTNAEKQTGAGFGFAMGDAVSGQFNLFAKLFGAESGNNYELYKAYVDGDTAHYNRVKARYEDEKAAEQALRKELRENDRRIGEAAKARIDGEPEVYESIVRAIVSEGIFDRNMVIRAVNNEISALEREMEKGTLVPEDPDAEETAESLYKASDLNAALERGDREDFDLIYDTILGERMEQGKTEAQAKAAVKSSITAYWKKQYLSGYQDTETRKRIIKLLTDTGLYGSRNDVATMCEGWVRAKK